MLKIAGTTPKRRNGLAWRSARGQRAGQSGKGVSREAGRASCLLESKPERKKDHRLNKILVWRSAFDRQTRRKEKAIEVIKAERNAKAARRAEAVLVSS